MKIRSGHRIIPPVALTVLILCLGWTQPVYAQFAGGSGTLNDPYQIMTAGQLDLVRGHIAAYFTLNNDIDLTDWLGTNSPSQGWNPIGTSSNPFSGTFDGNGHVISGLWVNRSAASYIGLFGYVKGSGVGIKKLGLLIAPQKIIGQNQVGGLLGYIESGTVSIQSCFVQGDISGAGHIGGIVGRSAGNLIISNCYSRGGTVSGTGNVGGLLGTAEKEATTVITDCYAANIVISSTSSGGIGGGVIASAGGSATVPANAYLTVTNCVALNPSITGYSSARILGWYKAGINLTLHNNAFKGGWVNGEQISNGNVDDKNGLNRTAEELTDFVTYQNLGWDLDNVWQMGNGNYQLPVLKEVSLVRQPSSLFYFAALEIPSILSDNMVLQSNSSVRIWGKARKDSAVTVSVGWRQGNVSAAANDSGYWETMVPTSDAGGPYSIRISSGAESKVINNILLGEVWICAGQSNMTMPVKGFDSTMPIEGSAEAIAASAANGDIRMFTADRAISANKEFNVSGVWQPASVNTTPNMSAVGYFYAVELKNTLHVPIGMIHLSWPGSTAQAWMSLDLLKLFPEIDLSSAVNMDGPSPQRIPSALFNGIFYPVSRFTTKGIIWYQGEDNVGANTLYAKIFPALANEWRTVIGLGNIPFYYVQLAPYKYSGSAGTEAALLREVQLNSQGLIPNSGMVTTGDLGNEELIHPSKKKQIAQRLSYWALAKTYGIAHLPYTSSIYQQKATVGNKITLAFAPADSGIVLTGDQQSLFTVAGSDNVFYPATVQVTGDKRDRLEIASSKVSSPLNVHYAFKNYFESVLYNSFMIPISPFRTEASVGNITLPVHLASFTGNRNGRENILQWHTNFEENSKGFAVLRGPEGQGFDSLAFVPAKKLSTGGYYEYRDRTPMKGNNMYRLQMIDLDGTTSYSAIVRLSGPGRAGTLQIYPNPAKDQITIAYPNLAHAGLLQITDVAGKIVWDIALSMQTTMSVVNIGHLSAGIYFIMANGYKASFIKE